MRSRRAAGLRDATASGEALASGDDALVGAGGMVWDAGLHGEGDCLLDRQRRRGPRRSAQARGHRRHLRHQQHCAGPVRLHDVGPAGRHKRVAAGFSPLPSSSPVPSFLPFVCTPEDVALLTCDARDVATSTRHEHQTDMLTEGAVAVTGSLRVHVPSERRC